MVPGARRKFRTFRLDPINHSRTPGASAERASTRQNRRGGGLQVSDHQPRRCPVSGTLDHNTIRNIRCAVTRKRNKTSRTFCDDSSLHSRTPASSVRPLFEALRRDTILHSQPNGPNPRLSGLSALTQVRHSQLPDLSVESPGRPV